MFSFVENVCVLGAGSTKYGKLQDNLSDITIQASVAAIKSAGIDPKARSGLDTFQMFLA